MKKTRCNKNEGWLPLCGNRWVLWSILIFTIHLTGRAHAIDSDAINEKSALWSARESTKPQSVIRGTVSDELGPLAGVTIVVKGTTKGTTTDFDGNYSIAVDHTDAVLVFSYIGYATQEIPVDNRDTINVVMVEDASKLEEVVVLGYTTKKKGELTGSVSTIDSKAIEQSSNKDLAKSLAGRASGLIINDRGGLPGAGNGTARKYG